MSACPMWKPIIAPVGMAPPRENITLSTGRVVVHTREPNGSQLATATPGNPGFTRAESQEYEALIACRPQVPR